MLLIWDFRPVPTPPIIVVLHASPCLLAAQTSLEHRRHKVEPTVLGLQEMLAYGLRGLCAYTHHAEVLGQRAKEVDEFVAEAYAFLSSEKVGDPEVEEQWKHCLLPALLIHNKTLPAGNCTQQSRGASSACLCLTGAGL